MGEINNSVVKALKILELYMEYESLNVAEIHGITGFSKAAITRIITSCESKGFIRKGNETGKYFLGSKLYFLGKCTDINSRIVERLRAPLEKLSQKLRLTISVSVMDNYESIVIYLRKSEMLMGLVPSLGTTRKLNCSAAGKVLTAFSDNLDEIIEVMNFKQYTGNTIMDKKTYAEAIRKVREKGYAIDDEELEEDLFCIAMPVLDQGGEVICSISVSGNKRWMTKRFDEIKSALKETVDEISALGIAG